MVANVHLKSIYSLTGNKNKEQKKSMRIRVNVYTHEIRFKEVTL